MTASDTRPCQRDRPACPPLSPMLNGSFRSGVMCPAHGVKVLVCPFVRRPCLARTFRRLTPAVSDWECPAVGQAFGHMSDTALSAACDRLPVIVSGYPTPWDTWWIHLN